MLSLFQFARRNNRRSPPGLLIWGTLVPWLVGSVCWLLWGFRTRGRRHIPRQGGALMLCNHQSHLDPMLVGVTLRDRGMRAMARKSLLTSPWPVPWLLVHAFDSIMLEQGAADPGAMRAALKELHEGRLSVIFPEGTRSPDGTVRPFQRGVWLLIKRGGVPVIPMAVEGTGECWATGDRPRLGGRQMLIIGEPIDPSRLLELGPDEGLALLRRTIDALRLEARAEIRRRTRGSRPRPGPADGALSDGVDAG